MNAKILMELQKEKKLVSIFQNPDNPQGHLTGFIYQFDGSDWVIVQNIHQSGWNDGYVAIHLDDIIRIDTDGMFEKCTGRLYTARHSTHYPMPESIRTGEDLIRYAQQQGKVLGVHLQEEDIYGYVNDYKDGELVLLARNVYGENNGLSYICLSDIILIEFDTLDEQDIELQANSLI